MKTFTTFMEDLASGRPMKKPVSSNLLQQRAKENTKALKSGFMKLTKQERDKEARRMSEEKKNCGCGQDPCITYGKKQMKEEDGSYYGKPSPRLKKKVKGAKEVVNNPYSKDDGKTVVAKQKKYQPQLSKSKQGINNVLKFLKKNPDYKIGAHSLKKKSKRLGEATASEVLKKRYASDHPDDNPHNQKRIKDHLPGMKTYKLHPGAKATDGGEWSKKGKMKALKKQIKRRPEQYGVTESARDNYDPVISDKRTKEKLKKAGLPPESPKVMEAKKPVVHSTKPDSLKTIKIKYNKPIRTKVTDIGAGGKEYVRKDWSEETFKPHDMWSPKGEKKFAKTEKEHLALKDKGWGHNNPNKSEEKKKGLDGKACWDGYKQMGTKKKGGKTVDNCVKMKEEQIQLVTNLDFNESLGNLVTRGMDKVRGAIKDAEKRTGYKVDPSKNNHSNPVSGKNIAKRLASQKKR